MEDSRFDALFAAEFGRDWAAVQRLSRQILSASTLEPWQEGSARRCLANSYLAMSMKRDDIAKLSLRQSAVDEARKSVRAYEADPSHDPASLSKSYVVLSTAIHLNAIALPDADMAGKTNLNQEAIRAARKALELHPTNIAAEEQLLKTKEMEDIYRETAQESDSKSGCLALIVPIAVLIPLIKMIVR